MSQYKSATLLTCALALTACAEQNTIFKQHENLIGTWVSPNSQLIIKKDGYLEYQTASQQQKVSSEATETSNTQSYISAPIHILTQNEIQMNPGTQPITFTIDVSPHQVKQEWHMSINGQDYVKK